ncbi:MAG: hypothetical protein WCD18_12235, partial [Thermosynechococcaceae cyanobacterium]
MPHSTSEMSRLEPMTVAEPTPVPWQRLGPLRRWWVMAIALLGCNLGAGTLGIFLLLQQPPKPNCSSVFWPFASGSLRITCAQEWARQNTLEDLFRAIDLVDGLSRHHALRPLIKRWVEIWSKQALDLAGEEFEQGNLERAITFAQKIPVRTTAHALVQQRIAYWKKVWAEGKTISDQANAALKAEDWRKAFSIMVGLISVDNRYWSQTQYEALNQRIIDAQKDETQVVKAQRLLEAGGLENLTKALELLQSLSDGTIFQKSIKTFTTKIARALVTLAESALDREDLTTALNALDQIPDDVDFWPEVQDWKAIAQAMSDTWSGDVSGYENAIAQLKKISPNRPLYTKVQDFILRWSSDIAYVRLLEEAQAQAADSTIEGLSSALAKARQIPSDSTQWEAAQQVIAVWSTELSDRQDQPILNQADALSLQGDPSSLQAAIRQAQQISVGNPLYAEAQGRIRDWQKQLEPPQVAAPTAPPPVESTADPDQESRYLLAEAQRLAAKGTAASLASAIETANQIPAQSALRAEAQQSMETWGNQMLDLAQSFASADRERAIAIAQQIPATSATYDTAQQQIRIWQSSP